MAVTPRPVSTNNGRILLLLTLIAAGLRFYRAGAQSIWVDEAATLKYAAVFAQYTWHQFVYDLHGPVYSALLHLWAHLFGTEESALRSLSVLLGTAAVPAFYWALLPLGRPRSAVLASALLAIHPFHIWYSQELRGYVLLFLAVILATGLFTRAPAGRARSWLLYGAANTLGLLANLSHLFALAAHGWAQLWHGRRARRVWNGLVLSWVATLLLVSPWIFVFWENHLRDSAALEPRAVAVEERIRGASSAPILGIPYTYYVFSVGYTLGPSLRELQSLNRSLDAGVLRPHLPVVLASGLLFGALALFGCVRLWRSGPIGRTWFWLAILPVLLVYATALRNLKVFNPRYAGAAFPPYVLAVSEGVLALGRRKSLVAGLALLLPAGASLAQHYHDPSYAKDDARGATEFLRSVLQPGDLLFVVGTDEPLHRYYWRGLRGNPDGIRKEDAGYWHDLPLEDRFRRFEKAREEARATYVLFLRDHWVDPDFAWRAYIADTHPPAAVERFVGAEVWRLPPRPGSGAPEEGGAP